MNKENTIMEDLGFICVGLFVAVLSLLGGSVVGILMGVVLALFAYSKYKEKKDE